MIFVQVKDAEGVKGNAALIAEAYQDSLLGYKNIPDAKFLLDEYTFKYLHPYATGENSKYLAKGAGKDSLLNVLNGKDAFRLIEDEIADYGYTVTADVAKRVGIKQLRRTEYAISLKDAYMDEAKEDKYAMSAYADPIDYFFLKENNHYEGECYYAIVKANSNAISNVKAGVTDDILDATVKVQPLGETRTSAFAINPDKTPLYRRFNNANLGEADGRDTLRFYENVRHEYLMDENNKEGGLTDEFVNYVGMWTADKATGLAFQIDTTWVVRGRGYIKPQYLISVAHNDFAGIEGTPCTEDGPHITPDGQITDDTDAYSEEQMEADIQEKEQKLSDAQTGKKKKKAKTSMSFFTALSLSMNNLMTKKTRTLLTAFAGSIGIIGIALILSISNGIQDYIDRVQRDTLSSYPVQLQSQTMDISSMIEMMTGSDKDSVDHDKDKVYSNMIMSEMMNTMISDVKNNNLKSFKKYIDDNKDEISTYASDIRYSYNIDINIYDTDTSDGVTQLNPSTIMNTIYGTNTSQGSMSAMYTNADVWNQLPGNQDLLDSQYDMVAGRWPQQYNEVVLVVDENNEIDDYTLYSLGFKDPDEVTAMYKRMMTGETYDTEETEYTYDEILDKKFQMILPTDYYRYNAEKDIWEDMREDETYMKNVVDNGTQIQVCGIIRQKEDAVNTAIRSGVGYTKELMQYLMQGVNDSEVAKAQLADETTDIFTGIPFDNDKDTPITMDDVNA